MEYATWWDQWLMPDAPPTQAEVLRFVLDNAEEFGDLMRRFPPACLVRARGRMMCPLPNSYGFVSGYVDGALVKVRQNPSESFEYETATDCLEVVGYHAGMTPEWVAGLLATRTTTITMGWYT